MFKKKFARRFKELRKSRGLTQEQLAEAVEVDFRYVSLIETAKSFPSPKLIEKFCDALSIDYSMLFDFSKDMQRENIVRNLNEIIETLDDKKLNYLYKMAIEL